MPSKESIEQDVRDLEINQISEEMKQTWDYNHETGKTNDSPLFNEIASEIVDIIYCNSKNIVRGNLDYISREILATLVHDYKLIPSDWKLNGEGNTISTVQTQEQ